jgi:rubrerythrin
MVERDLDSSAHEEAFAAAVYRDRKKVAEDEGDFQTAALYEHVAQEEDEHMEEFQKRLDEKGRRSGHPIAALAGKPAGYDGCKCGALIVELLQYTTEGLQTSDIVDDLERACGVTFDNLRETIREHAGRTSAFDAVSHQIIENLRECHPKEG